MAQSFAEEKMKELALRINVYPKKTKLTLTVAWTGEKKIGKKILELNARKWKSKSRFIYILDTLKSYLTSLGIEKTEHGGEKESYEVGSPWHHRLALALLASQGVRLTQKIKKMFEELMNLDFPQDVTITLFNLMQADVTWRRRVRRALKVLCDIK